MYDEKIYKYFRIEFKENKIILLLEPDRNTRFTTKVVVSMTSVRPLTSDVAELLYLNLQCPLSDLLLREEEGGLETTKVPLVSLL